MILEMNFSTFDLLIFIILTVAFIILILLNLKNRYLDKLYFCFKEFTIIQIVTSEECKMASLKLLNDCHKINALGFDCEWVSEVINGKSKRKPISLLQLATPNGSCFLFRLNQLGYIPIDLKLILEDSNLLKLGVNCQNDVNLLKADYGVQVQSYLDLRHLYSKEASLASMARNVIGVHLRKDAKIVSSDWNQIVLTNEQINYAAKDAWVAIEIYKKWLRSNSKNSFSVKQYIDLPFSQKKVKNITKGHNKGAEYLKSCTDGKKYARQTPLYDNCWMYAPDGELLCSCDKRKAEWYIQKGLAQIQKEDPFSIKLLFEPTTRPNANGDIEFYRQLKQNCCVICGSEESYMKHYVIPKEYRKHFPLLMKSHQSHDIVLTCAKCHSRCKNYMRNLKEELAIMCDAPIYTVQSIHYKKYTKLKNIWKTLLKSGDTIPKERKLILEKMVKEYFGLQNINNEILEKISVENEWMEKKKDNHGAKVVEFFKKKEGGLTQFEELWRKHFIETLQPKFLPSLWSITHNHKVLKNSISDN